MSYFCSHDELKAFKIKNSIPFIDISSGPKRNHSLDHTRKYFGELSKQTRAISPRTPSRSGLDYRSGKQRLILEIRLDLSIHSQKFARESIRAKRESLLFERERRTPCQIVLPVNRMLWHTLQSGRPSGRLNRKAKQIRH